MTKEEALAEIKRIRDRINNDFDHDDVLSTGVHWVGEVLGYLDSASDVLEFPRRLR